MRIAGCCPPAPDARRGGGRRTRTMRGCVRREVQVEGGPMGCAQGGGQGFEHLRLLRGAPGQASPERTAMHKAKERVARNDARGGAKEARVWSNAGSCSVREVQVGDADAGLLAQESAARGRLQGRAQRAEAWRDPPTWIVRLGGSWPGRSIRRAPKPLTSPIVVLNELPLTMVLACPK